MDFKTYLLNEQQIKQDQDKKYFGQRIGDVLSAIHDIEEDGKALGNRKMTKSTLRIVNQIRAILQDQWGSVVQPYLPVLQRCGVALMKSIEEKGDVIETLASAGDELEYLLNQLGVPINQIGGEDG